MIANVCSFSGQCFRSVSALFTYVSLDENRKVMPVPQLVVRTEGEQKRFEQGLLRYEEKKIERLKSSAEKRQKMDA